MFFCNNFFNNSFSRCIIVTLARLHISFIRLLHKLRVKIVLVIIIVLLFLLNIIVVIPVSERNTCDILYYVFRLIVCVYLLNCFIYCWRHIKNCRDSLRFYLLLYLSFYPLGIAFNYSILARNSKFYSFNLLLVCFLHKIHKHLSHF